MFVVNDDDLVVARESVDDPTPGGAATAGDENGFHACGSPGRGKSATVAVSGSL